MNIDLIAYQPDKYKIYLFDYSPVYQDNIDQQIYAMTLDISSLIITNGKIPEPVDLLAYFYSSTRVDNNLYIVTSEDLGLGEDQEIPDGVYEFTYTINNSYTKVLKFLVYKTVKERLDKILVDTNYNVTVGSYDIEYVNDSLDYDTMSDVEKVRFATTLYEELFRYGQIYDEPKVLNTLDKLQRLLTLIENEIN